jgi:glycosyltransferase involved in cell wall biosynthesis
MSIALIIPALNEAGCIGPLLAELPSAVVDEVIVVDNGSSDDTASEAAQAGAHVVREPRRGYGYACAAGATASSASILVFMDGDGSFSPAELPALVASIRQDAADLVVGTRMQGGMERGAMPAHQRLGNQFIAALLRWKYGLPVTDLGPFRAIRRSLLLDLDMQELTYGWPVEMLIKAAQKQARVAELPVSYRPRLCGSSKVGGSLSGTIRATYRILRVVFGNAA